MADYYDSIPGERRYSGHEVYDVREGRLMAEYTPTTEVVREVFIDGAEGEFIGEDFDRWMDAYGCEVRRQVAAEVRAEVEGWDRTGGSYARGKHRMYNLLADRIERGE